MESTLYVFGLMIVRILVPLLLLVAFGTWMEQRHAD